MSQRISPFAAVAAFLLLAVSACGSEPADPTEAANGIWKTDRGYFIKFTEDGTFGLGGSPERASTAPLEWGTFTFDGSTLWLTTADDSTYCTGTLASYTAAPSSDGDSIALTEIEDECSNRRADLVEGIRRVPEDE